MLHAANGYRIRFCDISDSGLEYRLKKTARFDHLEMKKFRLANIECAGERSLGRDP